MQRRKHHDRGARRVPRGALLLGPLVALTSAATASGQERRVALLEADPPIARALTVALSPWQLGVVPAAGPAPVGDLETASAGARVIATDQSADVVVWIAPAPRAGEPGSLCVYDTANQQLVVRRLKVSPPFDAAAAAAVALSVKTILRSSPLVSQYAQASSDDATTPSAPPPGVPAPPPPAPPAPPAVASPPGEATGKPPGPARGSWRFETLLGGRTPTGTGAAAEPWAELGLSLWPRGQRGYFGWGIDVKGGTGVALGTGAFQGEYRQGALDATARLRGAATGWLSFELRGGPEVIVTSFAGTPAGGAPIQAFRVDPALDFGGVVDFTPWARVNIGLVGDAAALLRFQRYSLDGSGLIDEPPFALVLGVRLSAEVD